MKAAPKLKRQKKLFTKRKGKNLPRPSHMRIDVTLWYRLITKGVITPNCYDGNSTISSTVPTSPTTSHYAPYDVNQSDGVRPILLFQSRLSFGKQRPVIPVYSYMMCTCGSHNDRSRENRRIMFDD